MLLFPSFGGFGVVPCIAFEAVIDLTVFYRAIAGLGIAIFRKSIYRAMMRKKLLHPVIYIINPMILGVRAACSRPQPARATSHSLYPNMKRYVTELGFKTDCR